MLSAKQAPIAITCGDPCGIGPEIILKAIQKEPALAESCIIVGHQQSLARSARALGIDLDKLNISIAPVAGDISTSELAFGTSCAAGGEVAYQAVLKAVDMIIANKASAIVTAPLTKQALHLAGHNYPGHTELFAELAGTVPVRMMLANDELRTVLVSIHVSLREALNAVTEQNVFQTIQITYTGLQKLGIQNPRIAVAGLNPHAGESGAFGSEEINIISPAIERAISQGIDASGPFPPDTIFMRARGFKHFDVVIAMYHDQGLIPVKYLGIEHGVNVTLGLPFVRTSPDHGTALDIAGKGLADCTSLLSAIKFARHATAQRP